MAATNGTPSIFALKLLVKIITGSIGSLNSFWQEFIIVNSASSDVKITGNRIIVYLRSNIIQQVYLGPGGQFFLKNSEYKVDRCLVLRIQEYDNKENLSSPLMKNLLPVEV